MTRPPEPAQGPGPTKSGPAAARLARKLGVFRMAAPASPEKSTSGSATRAGGISFSNLKLKQKEGAGETARGDEVRNAQ
eukprot:5166779-Prymnesium_polylepis.1